MAHESSRVLSQSRVLAVTPYRLFAKSLLSEKEKGDESIFFNKNDGKFNLFLILIEKALQGLMQKLKKQADSVDPTPAELERQKVKLREIFKDHKVDTELHKSFFDALVDWKRHL
jgi:hypothetical protein